MSRNVREILEFRTFATVSSDYSFEILYAVYIIGKTPARYHHVASRESTLLSKKEFDFSFYQVITEEPCDSRVTNTNVTSRNRRNRL